MDFVVPNGFLIQSLGTGDRRRNDLAAFDLDFLSDFNNGWHQLLDVTRVVFLVDHYLYALLNHSYCQMFPLHESLFNHQVGFLTLGHFSEDKFDLVLCLGITNTENPKQLLQGLDEKLFQGDSDGRNLDVEFVRPILGVDYKILRFLGKVGQLNLGVFGQKRIDL